MKRALLFAASFGLLAGGPMETVRVRISGGDLKAPIVLDDATALREFHVGKGPGNFRMSAGAWEPIVFGQGFIVDWSRGFADPPKRLTIYDVAFVTTRSARNTYAVRYAVEPATGAGYVYLPGKGEPGYDDNVFLIYRGVEGHWFHAWSRWEDMARPLIRAAARQLREAGGSNGSPLIRIHLAAPAGFVPAWKVSFHMQR